MLYGPNKVRSISRSVLPSRTRKTARADLAAVKRKNRRAVRRELTLVARDPEALFYRDKVDLVAYPDREIRQVMWRRRDADNLGAFLRWAEQSTADLDDPQDRFDAVRRAVPDSLIGRHALSHAEYLFEDDSWMVEYRKGAEARNASREARLAGLAAKVRLILESGYHAHLNRIVQERFGSIIVHGLHDVDEYADRVFHSPSLAKIVDEIAAIATSKPS